MKKITNKKIALSSVALLAPIFTMAQATNANTNSAVDPQINWILLCIAFILLIPIYITSKTFLFALKENIKKNKTAKEHSKKVGLILLFLAFSQVSQAQTFNAVDFSSNLLSWLLTGIIAFEAVLIIIFSKYTIKFLKPEKEESSFEENEYSESGLTKLWNKMNSFKPLSEEGEIDTGHEYDGIRELNNVTPPWFITAFLLTIVFAIVYMYRYHIGKTAPLQIEEYNIEMAAAEKEKSKILASEANKIDESNVVMLGASDIEAGKNLFTTTCAACHAPHGGSMVGGVGPNLTDDYWIHGGSLSDIFKSIKYGWPDKGMIAWESNYSPKQLAQLTSFIKSIRGSKPSGAKEPQGELFDESKTPNTTMTDTTKK
jgi:cytochrome c oxidase cbb3-type subunit 3